MQLTEGILTRRSIRKFRSEMVPKELLDKVMNAGIYAASAMNRQPTIIVAVTNREIRDELSAENARIAGMKEGTDPFYGAPVVLIVLSSAELPTRVYDGSLVLGNLMLAAHDLGLGTCWIHRAKEEFQMPRWQEWLHSLGIEGEYEGIGHLALGYPDGDLPAAPARKENRIFYAE